MKAFAVFLALCASTLAEPPLYRFQRFEVQRQQVAPTPDPNNREQITPSADDAGYAPSGWRPSGPQFTLPARQPSPDKSYGAPLNTYGAPDKEYGAPTGAETDLEENTTEKDGVEDTSTAELNEGEQAAEQAENVESNAGAYYLLLPDSTLQRVDYMTENDLRNMAYTARLQYRNEQPAPIYLYSSEQYIQLA